MNDTVSDWFSIMVCITAFILQNNIRAFFFYRESSEICQWRAMDYLVVKRLQSAFPVRS